MSTPRTAATLEHLISRSGALRLATYEWRPHRTSPHDHATRNPRPRAALVLAHGYGEHARRHEIRPIDELVRRGYLVAALDHRGHGRSEGPRATCERFDDLTEDYAALVRRTWDRYPDIPLYALGYSMGGLIALRYALTEVAVGVDLAGLIVAGVAIRPVPAIPGPLRPLAKALVRRIASVAPDLPVTPPCEDRCRPTADELCYSGPTPARMASELLAAGDDALARAHNLTCPLLVLHGALDRVTGPQGAADLHKRASSADRTLLFFEGIKHQVLTTTRSSEARLALLRWLDERCAVPRSPARRCRTSSAGSGRPRRSAA